MERPTKQEADQKHADYYINEVLMNPEVDDEMRQLDMPQIALAVRRLANEDVAPKGYHPGVVEVKYKKHMGTYVEKKLGNLLDGNVTSIDEIKEIKLAIQAVELGEVIYPVKPEYLTSKLNEIKQKLSF